MLAFIGGIIVVDDHLGGIVFFGHINADHHQNRQ
ncbi:Uncharacterised protein [Shigella sonnei]|nr:Uncharacterised protein [Shigella sonnei]VFT07057.1 Uncharacterised protein [Escherichia coli]